jgi:hypothetical protein
MVAYTTLDRKLAGRKRISSHINEFDALQCIWSHGEVGWILEIERGVEIV